MYLYVIYIVHVNCLSVWYVHEVRVLLIVHEASTMPAGVTRLSAPSELRHGSHTSPFSLFPFPPLNRPHHAHTPCTHTMHTLCTHTMHTLCTHTMHKAHASRQLIRSTPPYSLPVTALTRGSSGSTTPLKARSRRQCRTLSSSPRAS
jgi:hypothetical protein